MPKAPRCHAFIGDPPTISRCDIIIKKDGSGGWEHKGCEKFPPHDHRHKAEHPDES